MAAKPLPPVEYLRQCLLYDPETGALTWRTRPVSHFRSVAVARAWNSSWAGRPAGTITRSGYVRFDLICDGEQFHVMGHRAAWAIVTGEDRPLVDHKDGVGANNRWGNLRPATCVQNQANTPGKRSSPWPKGVVEIRGRFVAKIRVEGRQHHIGSYDTPALAHEAYCRHGRLIHGEFFNPGPAKPSIFD